MLCSRTKTSRGQGLFCARAMQHCSIARACEKSLVPHGNFFPAMEQNLLKKHKKMSPGHGDKIDSDLFCCIAPGTKFMQWSKIMWNMIKFYSAPTFCNKFQGAKVSITWILIIAPPAKHILVYYLIYKIMKKTI